MTGERERAHDGEDPASLCPIEHGSHVQDALSPDEIPGDPERKTHETSRALPEPEPEPEPCATGNVVYTLSGSSIYSCEALARGRRGRLSTALPSRRSNLGAPGTSCSRPRKGCKPCAMDG